MTKNDLYLIYTSVWMISLTFIFIANLPAFHLMYDSFAIFFITQLTLATAICLKLFIKHYNETKD